MTLKQLEYVDMVAKTGNITEAADLLYISQPSLTHAIRQLEKEMGVVVFSRGNKGVTVTAEGEELLGYARQVIEQARLMEDRFLKKEARSPKFCVSCQHYSFAVNAFVDVVREFEAAEYDFTLRETETHEIIEDVSQMRSEIGILYLSKRNADVMTKAFKRHDLVFEELFVAEPHIFIGKDHPLAAKNLVTMEDLDPYPYLSYEQGDYNSFYYSEEILSSLERRKNIRVRDRATLFNLAIGLNGYTVCSGVISRELNGGNIIARKLAADENMHIGTIRQRRLPLSRYGKTYLKALKKYTESEGIGVGQPMPAK